MANLKDIAQKLGVSVSTVSRGLNGGKEISREMTEKILKAADELGYTLQGRGGRATPDWNSAGIIVPEVASEYYARLVHKAKDFLAAKGYSLIMKLTDFKAAELLDAINTMSRIHVKCLLVVMDTEENMSDQLISAMHRSGLPIMLITSKYYPLLEFDCIHLDEYSGIIMGVQHLQKRGYQRIACISDRISLSRVTVFKQAMKLQGMKVDPQLICVGPERAESGGYLRTKELLSLENPPDAVFCCYDQMAIGAIHALRESGLRKLICVPSVCKLTLFEADDPVTETNPAILMVCLRDQLHFLRCILWMHCESADIVIRRFIWPHDVIQKLLVSKLVCIFLRDRLYFKDCHVATSHASKDACCSAESPASFKIMLCLHN